MKLKPTNKLKTTSVICGITIALGLLATVKADTIYRETFGRPSGGTAPLDTSAWGWMTFSNGVAAPTATTSSAGGVSQNVGSPISLANVNAGLNGDGTSTAYDNGYIFFNAKTTGPFLTYTPEYSVNPVDYVPGSLTFDWYQSGNRAANIISVSLAVQIGGLWYASATTFSTPSIGVTAPQFKSLMYDPTAANWLTINFDGTYDGVTTTTDSSVALSLGANPGADLSGIITAFGLYETTTTDGTLRVDVFEINATPVPEPTTATLLGLGATAVIAFWRRKRQVC